MGSRDGIGDSTEGQAYAADIDSIREAQVRIAPYVHRTPVLSSTSIDVMVGKQLFFKCECFQKAGAFKIRGASNSIFALDDEQASKGVVTHSSGNHAAAVALAAKLRGIPAHIVIPRNAPACKVENVKRYGGHIIWSDVSIESRESVCKRVQEETGAVLIHPFNNKYTIRPVVRDLVDDVIVVDDTAIVDAMKICYEILKVAVEPSGAIGLAAALSEEFKQSSAWHESSKIGIIVSGGNVDLGALWESLYKQ